MPNTTVLPRLQRYMNNRYSHCALLTLILGAVVIPAAGCNSNTHRSSHAATAVPGRRIEAHADGPVSVQNFGQRAAVSILSHEVGIERDRVLLDGVELAKLPEDATHIGVTAARGELTLTADGVPVAKTQLGK
jgi:hypothetical protein